MKEYKLIDGEFSPDDAKKVLLSILNSKINFHNLLSFSNHIRFNNDINTSKNRIEELNNTKTAILELIEKATKENLTFKIKSNISIELI